MQKYSWGGYRPGSGRRPKGEVSGVSHHTRAELSGRHPVRVALKTKPELGTMFIVAFQYAGEATPRFTNTGVYRDRFVRTSAGWKFARREILDDQE